uniref:Uncharacterized protein n=1 Tax=Rhinolophus ferrumequinum TaxID=59479 RepID=A0A671EDZ6_RHIFE
MRNRRPNLCWRGKLPAASWTPTNQERVRFRCRDPINVGGLLPSKIRIRLKDNVQYVSIRKALKTCFDLTLRTP